MIYFDNAATTYPKPDCVYKAIEIGMQKYSFNAGRGRYEAAQETYNMIEETREMLGSIVGVSGNKVIFTSSATESLNNILYGLDLHENDVVFISPFEHNAVARTLHHLGVKLEFIPFDKVTWELDEKRYKDLLLLYKPKAVVISHVSNVTGYELPYKKIFDATKCIDSVNILDCSQSFGVYNISKESIDYVVFAGHKSLYAMFGIAGYICTSSHKLNVHKVGGTGSDSLNLNMPDYGVSRYEAGSLNSVGIYSIHESLGFLKENDFESKKMELTSFLIDELNEIEGVTLYLPENKKTKGIVSFNIEGYSSADVGEFLANDYDICVRTGYHCAPFIHDFIGSKLYAGTVRVSLSGFNTKEEIDELISAIQELI